MADTNGKFVRGIFWTLLLASFAWSTTVLAISAKLNADEQTKRESADKNVCDSLSDKLDKILNVQTAQACDIAAIKEHLKVKDDCK